MRLNGRVIAFRADASVDIGTGHVMRCLTLADSLRRREAVCHFICRRRDGDLIDTIRQRGYPVQSLPEIGTPVEEQDLANGPAHAAWLQTDQRSDALETLEFLDELDPAWLIVDHYGIDAGWETMVRKRGRRLMAIDDLADRHHDCDVLLDHNLGRKADSYAGLVPATCELLMGERYALLRPEFAKLRKASLQRRKSHGLRSLLISMGGIDRDNDTSTVLEALRNCDIPTNCRIVIVLGSACPWTEQVEKLASALPWETMILRNTDEMARIMSQSDLAIGAGGVTGLERVCLGLPSIMLETADNQKYAMASFTEHGLATTAPGFQYLTKKEKLRTIDQLFQKALVNRNTPDLIDSACDGLGSERVSEFLATMGTKGRD